MATAIAVASCALRPLYIEGETPMEVLVINDWTQLGADPEGATIYFYPESGSAPWVFKTNSVARTTVKVPSGYYTVQVFNRTVDEFGSMYFKDMDTLGTAKAILDDKLFSWLGRADSIGRTVYEPEEIVVGRRDHFQVRAQSEREIWQREHGLPVDPKAIVDSVIVTPQRVRYTGTVSVRINGIQNIRSVRSYLTGMAGSAYLATRTGGEALATHVLESWSISRESTDYTKGYVVSNFYCFGLPEQYLGDPYDKNNKLFLQFRLVDNQTVIQEIRYVGAIVHQNDDERTVTIVIDSPITLPDVKPEGGSESGFDVNIEDWTDPEDVQVPI